MTAPRLIKLSRIPCFLWHRPAKRRCRLLIAHGLALTSALNSRALVTGARDDAIANTRDKRVSHDARRSSYDNANNVESSLIQMDAH